MSSANIPIFKAVVMDMDGVITQTARLHAKAWKEMFDEFLEKREGKDYQPFSIEKDYKIYIDGKPRFDGVRSFLQSRNISLPEGQPGDDINEDTVYGLGMRKNKRFLELLGQEAAQVYPDALQIVRQWKEESMKLAIISSSRNCKHVLESAGVLDLFDARVDGMVSEEKKLKGKPAPDIFLEASEILGVSPAQTIVIEDAIAGIEAGKKGKFGLVIGVARHGEEEALKEAGADIVVNTLSGLLAEIRKFGQGKMAEDLPHVMEKFKEIRKTIGNRKPVLLLDYDGTLSPIVSNPEDALLPEKTKSVLQKLSELIPVAVISGRDRADVQAKVGLENLIYAGSHGFDITEPHQMDMEKQVGQEILSALDEAEHQLQEKLQKVAGCRVERKKYAIAVHFRNVADSEVQTVKNAVYEELDKQKKLRKGSGKKILELKPDIDWHKGRATNWLLDSFGKDSKNLIPVFIGDDITDEDALEAIAEGGIGILVGLHGEKTAASYRLQDTDEVAQFLEQFYNMLIEKGYG